MPWNERLGRRIKLNGLRVLQSTIAVGSMAGAARDLGMTQPAVSYAIGEMERALGVPLLDRTPQGVLPTPYGEALARRSTAVFNELRQGIEDIAFLADPGGGEIRIGATPPMSLIAAAAINRLIERYPRMTFHLIVEPTDVLLRQLGSRSLELAISRMIDPATPDWIESEVLFHDRLSIIAGKRNPWARRRRPIELHQLMGGPWALPPPEGFLSPLIRSAFAARGLPAPQATVTTQSTYTLATLASEGPFLIIHPETMLRVPVAHPDLAALPVVLEGARNPIELLRLKDRAISPVAAVFAQAVRDVVRAAGLARTPRPRRTASP
ncbi:MAG: LysR family transcriptional regulator [Reyranellaceae bacterium]